MAMQRVTNLVVAPSVTAGICLALALARGAAADPAPPVSRGGPPERHAVVLARRATLAFASLSGRCAADPTSLDVLRGSVERMAGLPTDGTAVYEGTVQRSTDQTLCGSEPHLTGRLPTRNAQPCRARLSGAADLRLRLKVRSTGPDLQTAWIVLTPIDAMAEVTGNCSPGELREMRRAYSERITIEIPLPEGRLTPGHFTAADDEPGRWQMTVSAAS